MEKIFGLERIKGSINSGYFSLGTHPMGIEEKVPITIIEGEKEGPIISITAGLHGDEYTGILVCQELANDPKILKNLSGTIIICHLLNPLGFAKKTREHGFLSNIDLNRLFPTKEKITINKFTEQCLSNFTEELSKHTTLHLDLHCSKSLSLPFCYIDHILNPEDQNIQDESIKFTKFTNLFPVFNNIAAYQFNQYHRTLSGSLINYYKIPALTFELGAKKFVEQFAISLGKDAITNILVKKKLLPKSFYKKTEINIQEQHIMYIIKTNTQGIHSFKIKPGDKVIINQILAIVYDLFGKEIGKIKADKPGKVIAIFDGLHFYEEESIIKIASPL